MRWIYYVRDPENKLGDAVTTGNDRSPHWPSLPQICRGVCVDRCPSEDLAAPDQYIHPLRCELREAQGGCVEWPAHITL